MEDTKSIGVALLYSSRPEKHRRCEKISSP